VCALIDTGATGTGIRQDVAMRLALEKRGRRRIFTANGDIIADEHLIRIGMYVGDFPDSFDLAGRLPFVLEEEVMAYALHPNFSFEMLIGMDIISQMDLSLSRTGEVSLRLP
jgi:predicted aspartyl protease